jgi:putative transcriptional regulator
MHVDAQLMELALGILPRAERAPVEEHLAGCARCRAELDALREVVGAAGAQLAPVQPAPIARLRLLDSARAPGRYAFADLVGRVFDLPREGAVGLLDAVDRAASWVAGPLPGVELFHFEAGPRLAGADTGLVRFAPGVRFPRHTHVGPETMIVLEGGYTDEDGTVYGPGAWTENAAGSSHAFVCDARAGCLAGVVVVDGIDIEGYGPVSVKKPGA